MSSPNQSYEADSGMSRWVSQEELRWYALHTRARHEKAVERRLRDQGMETFLPTAVEVHRWSDRKKKVEVPLFSCYVFIRCALSAADRTRVYQVESVHGFVALVGRASRFPMSRSKVSRRFWRRQRPGVPTPFSRWGSGSGYAAGRWTEWKACFYRRMATTA